MTDPVTLRTNMSLGPSRGLLGDADDDPAPVPGPVPARVPGPVPPRFDADPDDGFCGPVPVPGQHGSVVAGAGSGSGPGSQGTGAGTGLELADATIGLAAPSRAVTAARVGGHWAGLIAASGKKQLPGPTGAAWNRIKGQPRTVKEQAADIRRRYWVPAGQSGVFLWLGYIGEAIAIPFNLIGALLENTGKAIRGQARPARALASAALIIFAIVHFLG